MPDVFTLIDWVVWLPGLHKYDDPALAVSVTEPPEQNVVAPLALMFTEGRLFTVTVTGAETDGNPFDVTVTM